MQLLDSLCCVPIACSHPNAGFSYYLKFTAIEGEWHHIPLEMQRIRVFIADTTYANAGFNRCYILREHFVALSSNSCLCLFVQRGCPPTNNGDTFCGKRSTIPENFRAGVAGSNGNTAYSQCVQRGYPSKRSPFIRSHWQRLNRKTEMRLARTRRHTRNPCLGNRKLAPL